MEWPNPKSYPGHHNSSVEILPSISGPRNTRLSCHLSLFLRVRGILNICLRSKTLTPDLDSFEPAFCLHAVPCSLDDETLCRQKVLENRIISIIPVVLDSFSNCLCGVAGERRCGSSRVRQGWRSSVAPLASTCKQSSWCRKSWRR